MKKFMNFYSPENGGTSGASAQSADIEDSLFESIEGSAAGNETHLIDGMEAVNAKDSEGKPLKPEEQVDDEPVSESFESLINGKYKEEYQKAVKREAQSIAQGAFKDHRKTSERLTKAEQQLTELKPLINAMASKYGIDPKDVKSIIEAADRDNSNFEREAVEKGFGDTNAYRQYLKNERELNDYREEKRRQQETATRQQEQKRLVDGWLAEADSFKKDFPEFDFKSEWQNDKFKHLLMSGWSVKDAYSAVHPDDYAKRLAKQAEDNVIQEVRANKRRVTENGAGPQAGLRVTKSVDDMSLADMERVILEAKSGKKIAI